MKTRAMTPRKTMGTIFGVMVIGLSFAAPASAGPSLATPAPAPPAKSAYSDSAFEILTLEELESAANQRSLFPIKDTCDWAPGALGALHCASIKGEKLYVEYGSSAYAGVGNICSATSNFRHTPYGGTQKVTSKTDNGCLLGGLGIKWNVGGSMKNNTTFCARQKNSGTGYVFSSYSCFNIYQ